MSEKKKLKVEIDNPVEVDGIVFDSLTFGVFRAKHFKYIPDKLFESQEDMTQVEITKLGLNMMPLIAAMADVSEQVIEELEFVDYIKVMEEFTPFLEQSLPMMTGKS